MGLYRNSHTRKKSKSRKRQTALISIMNPAMTKLLPPGLVTSLVAIIYILSGICQPLLMTVCKHAGLADSSAQLYMLFYYLGPSLVVFQTFCQPSCCKLSRSQQQLQLEGNEVTTISATVVLKASMVAMFDIVAQSFNYTGASYAGATIFAVIYSSVTIWTAIFSRCLLRRNITYVQCIAILIVFCGLCFTSFDSVSLGSDVLRGTIYVLIGSCMHGATYVFSEAIMMTSHGTNNVVCGTTGSNSVIIPTGNAMSSIDDEIRSLQKRELLTFTENSAIQGMVACVGLFSWQIAYTFPRWDELVRQPAQAAGTTLLQGAGILLAFSLANLFHSLSFYYTVAHYPGGSTSAGVMKGLQAVLVFVVAHFIYCRANDDLSMCFTPVKFLSLITVVGGVAVFRFGASNVESIFLPNNKAGYTSIQTDE